MRLFILLAVVGMVALGWGAWFFLPHIAYRADDPAYNRAYWKQEVVRLGASAAYAEFKTRTAAMPTARQHFAAHVIGNVLGEAGGANAISVCDSSFGFGCYHGLFGEIIGTGGESLIPTLDAACVKAFGSMGTGCQHGIGHGILEYVGYEKLGAALDLCKETTQRVPLLGCTSGVFMEYFFPLSGPDNGLLPSARAFDPAHPDVPCGTVDAAYQESCYYEMGGWLRASTNEAETVCATFEGKARVNCFLGVGALAAHMHDYQASTTIAECAGAPQGNELLCRAGAWWGFYQVPEHRADANQLCAYTDPALTKKCLSLGNLTHEPTGA